MLEEDGSSSVKCPMSAKFKLRLLRPTASRTSIKLSEANQPITIHVFFSWKNVPSDRLNRFIEWEAVDFGAITLNKSFEENVCILKGINRYMAFVDWKNTDHVSASLLTS